MPLQRKLIEQSSQFDLPMTHHDSLSCFWQRLNHRTSSIATTDFFNKIDRFRLFGCKNPVQIGSRFAVNRELDDALKLTAMASETLADARTGKNGRHPLAGLFRQSVFGRLAARRT
jgi:hypothetical protein